MESIYQINLQIFLIIIHKFLKKIKNILKQYLGRRRWCENLKENHVIFLNHK